MSPPPEGPGGGELFSAGVMNAKTPSLAYKVPLGIAQQMSEKLRETNTHIRAS